MLGNLEVGIDGPLIAIYNASESGQKNAFGLSDLDLQVKYRLHSENEHTPWPTFTLGFYVEGADGRDLEPTWFRQGRLLAEWNFAKDN